MEKVLNVDRCKSIFKSSAEEDICGKFTELWVMVINNQENRSNIVTLKNNVLQADTNVL